MRKWLVAMLSMILLVGVFVKPLGAETEDEDSKEPLVVGMECNYAPFNWTQIDDRNGAVKISDGTGYCNGYDVSIATRLAEGLNRRLVIKKMAWEGLEPALKSGVIDMIVAGMSPTEERKQSMSFTNTYFDSKLVMVVQKNSSYVKSLSIQDFKGAKVVAQLGTFHDGLIDQINGVQHETPMSDYPSMTVALKSGRVDAITAEWIVAKSIVASNKDLAIVEFEEGKGFDLGTNIVSVAAGVRQDNPELVTEANAVLEKISVEEREQLASEAVLNQPEVMPDGFFEGVVYLVKEYSGLLLSGIGITLLLALVGTIVGFLLGLLIAVIRRFPVIKYLVSIYIEVLRGTPMIVQAMLVFYGLAALGIHVPTLPAGLFIVSINTSAYMAEIIRGGIQSLDKGQFEAAKALGMSHWAMMRKIILPQAIKNALPAIGNEFIVNVKDTSVLNVISVTELFFQAKTIAGIHYRTAEAFFIVSVIYLFLTICITRVLAFIEKRLLGDKAYHIPGSQTTNSAMMVKNNEGGH